MSSSIKVYPNIKFINADTVMSTILWITPTSTNLALGVVAKFRFLNVKQIYANLYLIICKYILTFIPSEIIRKPKVKFQGCVGLLTRPYGES